MRGLLISWGRTKGEGIRCETHAASESLCIFNASIRAQSVNSLPSVMASDAARVIMRVALAVMPWPQAGTRRSRPS
jgi:hypothetical protein